MATDRLKNLNSSEIKMFEEIGSVLNKYKGKTREFGLHLVHSHFELNQDEVLHETNNKESRVLTVHAIPKSDLPKNAFPTAWNINYLGNPEVALFCCEDPPDIPTEPHRF